MGLFVAFIVITTQDQLIASTNRFCCAAWNRAMHLVETPLADGAIDEVFIALDDGEVGVGCLDQWVVVGCPGIPDTELRQ